MTPNNLRNLITATASITSVMKLLNFCIAQLGYIWTEAISISLSMKVGLSAYHSQSQWLWSHDALQINLEVRAACQ